MFAADCLLCPQAAQILHWTWEKDKRPLYMSRHLAQDLENDLQGIGMEMASLDLRKQDEESSAGEGHKVGLTRSQHQRCEYVI